MIFTGNKKMAKLVTLEVYNSRMEAELARGYLESMGIETSITADDAGELYPSLGKVRGVKLLARPEDAQKANKLLKDKK
jgi:hypothetical protein